MKKSRKLRLVRPQLYEHRTEVVLEALQAIAAAQEQLMGFLLEQQGPEWRRQSHRIHSANRSLKAARCWLRKANRLPTPGNNGNGTEHCDAAL